MKRINELGEPDSTIVTQRYYYDRTSAEIAKELGMRPSAVRMRSARALKRLKKALEKDGCTL
ncbi:MAG: sigma-70 family RNA polymerase sigma factor [Ruminococcus sp.]|nr:sigma-70 family RNA polymerase sigma factor [Ruminococcus sp.]